MTTRTPTIPDVYNLNFQRLYGKYDQIKQKIKNELNLDVNFKITSDYRNTYQNRSCGGVQNSQHTRAEALDFQPKSEDIEKIFNMLEAYKKELELDQLILEHDTKGKIWIHFSIADSGKQPRGECFYLEKGGNVSKFSKVIMNKHNELTTPGLFIDEPNNYNKDKSLVENLANVGNSGKILLDFRTVTSDKIDTLKSRMAKNKHLNKLLIQAQANKQTKA